MPGLRYNDIPHVKSTSMYYKKVQGEKYEPDWIAVSSTIIPLVERHTNVGVGFRVGSSTGSEKNDGYEGVSTVDKYYKQAYVKHISKKYTKVGTAGAFVQPGTLITGKTTNSNKKDAH
ncbi:uncharacterized protein LOC128728388 [Anopheles nili]|uniref:uncharacterized protein LOC128728388 n=1 Tax=Anopheles nili TaxID=185578 RepID=UPI00237A9785|nr:uncharacterized protein LOC128728388 [Anopheles nili]